MNKAEALGAFGKARFSVQIMKKMATASNESRAHLRVFISKLIFLTDLDFF